MTGTIDAPLFNPIQYSEIIEHTIDDKKEYFSDDLGDDVSQTRIKGTRLKSAIIPKPGGYDRPTKRPEIIDSFFLERVLINVINNLKYLNSAARK